MRLFALKRSFGFYRRFATRLFGFFQLACFICVVWGCVARIFFNVCIVEIGFNAVLIVACSAVACAVGFRLRDSYLYAVKTKNEAGRVLQAQNALQPAPILAFCLRYRELIL